MREIQIPCTRSNPTFPAGHLCRPSPLYYCPSDGRREDRFHVSVPPSAFKETSELIVYLSVIPQHQVRQLNGGSHYLLRCVGSASRWSGSFKHSEDICFLNPLHGNAEIWTRTQLQFAVVSVPYSMCSWNVMLSNAEHHEGLWVCAGTSAPDPVEWSASRHGRFMSGAHRIASEVESRKWTQISHSSSP